MMGADGTVSQGTKLGGGIDRDFKVKMATCPPAGGAGHKILKVACAAAFMRIFMSNK